MDQNNRNVRYSETCLLTVRYLDPFIYFILNLCFLQVQNLRGQVLTKNKPILKNDFFLAWFDLMIYGAISKIHLRSSSRSRTENNGGANERNDQLKKDSERRGIGTPKKESEIEKQLTKWHVYVSQVGFELGFQVNVYLSLTHAPAHQQIIFWLFWHHKAHTITGQWWDTM